MGRSTKVMTPRNVELPLHVIKANNGATSSIAINTMSKMEKKPRHRKKCLCFTSWLLVLIILCAGIVVLAHFLFPKMSSSETSAGLMVDDNDNNANGTLVVHKGSVFFYDRTEAASVAVEKCLEDRAMGLNEKVELSELVVVGKLDSDDEGSSQIRVRKLLKKPVYGDIGKRLDYLEATSNCQSSEKSSRRAIFFLSEAKEGSSIWVSRFRAMPVSEKLTQVIGTFVDKQLQAPETECGICLYGGHCEGSECVCNDLCNDLADNDLSPVCGSDLITYKNLCQMKQAACGKQQNITLISEGSCGELNNCPDKGCPYFGECVQVDAGAFECQCKKCAPEQEVNEDSLVCGTDGVEYASECHLESAACLFQKDVRVKKEGSCNSCLSKLCDPNEECILRESGEAECVCQGCHGVPPEEVCGSDGITYFSTCHMNRASCIQEQKIWSMHSGPCDKCKNVECHYNGLCNEGKCICNQRCPNNYEPVCASDGKTYLNFCALELANCQRQQDTNFRALEVVESQFCAKEKAECQTSICACPRGVAGLNCDRCMPKFWAFTSFGCRECDCNMIGSESAVCNPQNGVCRCKPGFGGEKCEICPDGTLANVTNCLKGSTRYPKPISCGDSFCNFGATCSNVSGRSQCICEIECRNPLYYREAVCGSDGETYRSECQLRQYSCRHQREVAIVKYAPCEDAPPSIYGNPDYRHSYEILSDATVASSTASKPSLSSVGAPCLDDSDCDDAFAVCSSDGKCVCQDGYQWEKDSNTCIEVARVSTCDPNPCHNGGACEEHDNIFSCYCEPGFAGDVCQHDLGLRGSGSVETAGFSGKSFVAALSPQNAISRFEIRMEMRAFAPDGILMFSQGSESESDFISVSLTNSYVEFRFDLGGGSVTLTSNSKISLGSWHRIVAKRYHRDGLLEVHSLESDSSDVDRVTGSVRGSLKTLNIGELTWIGGIEDAIKEDALRKAGHDQGFVGCMRDLELNRVRVIIRSEHEPRVMKRIDVGECENNACVRLPCGDHGVCSAQDIGFKCTCHSDYTGHQCQKRRNECHPNPCQNDGQCRMLKKSSSSFECLCKKGFSGRLCEVGNDDSWERFRKSALSQERQKLSFGIQTNLTGSDLINFKINSNDPGQSSVTLTMLANKEGFFQYKISNSSWAMKNPHTTAIRISDNEWHRIDVIFQNHGLKVHADDIPSEVEGFWNSLDFTTDIHIGSHANGKLCIRHLLLRKRKNNRFEKSKPVDICK